MKIYIYILIFNKSKKLKKGKTGKVKVIRRTGLRNLAEKDQSARYIFGLSKTVSIFFISNNLNTVATLSTTVILVYPNTSNIIQFNSTSASSHQSHFAPYANFQALFFLERSACYSA